jgi:hypothetical protein
MLPTLRSAASGRRPVSEIIVAALPDLQVRSGLIAPALGDPIRDPRSYLVFEPANGSHADLDAVGGSASLLGGDI